MRSGILDRLSSFDVRGYVIVTAILLCLLVSLVTTLGVRARYARIAGDLTEKAGVVPFESALLRNIVQEVTELSRASRGGGQALNIQAIIEHNFQQRLRGALLGERFVRSSVGLVIILGLVGTFYGLSLSIGKLVALLSADSGTVDITQALTVGLTDTLSGMSVAFTSSLAGIASAILLTLLGVFLNVSSARTGLMLQIETYLDRLLAEAPTGIQRASSEGFMGGSAEAAELGEVLGNFGQSVAQLDGTATPFEAALQNFATTTRDFREFNLHLKDNVQRMSLSFADLSEVLARQTSARTVIERPRGENR